MRKRYPHSRHSTEARMEAFDLEDRFVLRTCIDYCLKTMTMAPLHNEEAIECYCRLMGSRRQEITTFFQNHFPGRIDLKRHEDLLNPFSRCGHFAADVTRILCDLSPHEIERVTELFEKILKERFDALKYSGLSTIEKNLKKLKTLFALTDSELKLCACLFITSEFDFATSYFENHLEIRKFSSRKYLFKMLDITTRELSSMLSGKLQEIGLIAFDRRAFKENVELSDDFKAFFDNPSEQSFSKQLFKKCQGKSLPLSFHMIEEDSLEHMIRLLGAKTKTPAHVLLYGPPGAGKSSFAFSLARATGARAYKILTKTENDSTGRRAAIVACINYTEAQNGGIIIVDEADNILNTDRSWFSHGEIQDKGWLNQLLEQPGIRMIWITNQISGIDPSVLRRFSYSRQFKPYTREQRILLWENILQENCAKRFFSRSDIIAFAKHNVTAGVIDLAIKKAKDSAPRTKTAVCKAVTLSLAAYESLLEGGTPRKAEEHVEAGYGLEGLNVSSNLDGVLRQLHAYNQSCLQKSRCIDSPFNLLFFGPPGTGKSELARHIAEDLERPLLCKRASDLLNAYVGETEKLIRRAFQEAENENAVLVLDEADSFLYSRENATRSWEVSFTNEFLTQMERFRGILICTTNRFDHLDTASIRRFSHKIEFNWLTSESNVLFYEKLLSGLVSKPTPPAGKKILSGIQKLAPGDFKTVRTQYAFYPKTEITHELLIAALRSESELKTKQSGEKKIGF